MGQLALIVHNVRSCHNVGSLLRTAEGLGIEKVYLTGYTPYPLADSDGRLPHEAMKADRQIHKTALGAEKLIEWQHMEQVSQAMDELRSRGYVIAALEQAPDSRALPGFKPPAKLALVVGREVEGLEDEVLAQTGLQLEIPMFGKKESFNVVQAAAMAMFYVRFSGT